MKGIMQEVLLVAIVVTSTLVVVNMITPTIDDSSSYQNYGKAKEAMSVVNSVIKDILLEGSGATRSIKLVSDFGTFIVSGKDDRIIFNLVTNSQILDPGTTLQEGDMTVTAGGAMKAYEGDINSDSVTDLILENDAVTFAIKKIGAEDLWQSINTTTMIIRIGNKQTGINVTPVSGIYISDTDASAYGSGYARLSRQGMALGSSAIEVFVNSTNGEQYRAIFTLRATSDFVELEVKQL